MIRAIYRWQVQPGTEDAFVQAWMWGTRAIRTKVKGARGVRGRRCLIPKPPDHRRLRRCGAPTIDPSPRHSAPLR